jgi:hypothetical protein
MQSPLVQAAKETSRSLHRRLDAVRFTLLGGPIRDISALLGPLVASSSSLSFSSSPPFQTQVRLVDDSLKAYNIPKRGILHLTFIRKIARPRYQAGGRKRKTMAG